MSYGESMEHGVMLNGEYFDSETEAAWALYFQNVGMPYVREYARFSFNSFIYTPDFYLPEQDSFVEVKNGNADWLACYKLAEVARRAGKLCILANGKPHNFAVYFFGSQGTNVADRRATFPFNTYADAQLVRPQLLRAGEPANEDSRIILDAAMAARTGWTHEVDPAVAYAAYARKQSLEVIKI